MLPALAPWYNEASGRARSGGENCTVVRRKYLQWLL